MTAEYLDFIRQLREKLCLLTGLPADRVRFVPRGGTYAEEEDKLLIERGDKDDPAHEICGVFTEELYRHYRNTGDLELVARAVERELFGANADAVRTAADRLNAYETARPELFIRLLNVGNAGSRLDNAVYRTVGDIAQVLYIRVAEGDGQMVSTKVGADRLEEWQADPDQVLDDAFLNTYFLFPPRLYHWENLLGSEDEDGENFMDLLHPCTLHKGFAGNCISTRQKVNGAVAIFLPGVLGRISEVLSDDLLLAFTSIHEVMVHAASEIDPGDIKHVLVQTIDETTPPGEVLSRGVYRYYREKERVELVLP